MRIAILTTDNRENDRNYSAPAPYFGTAPSGLLAGFAGLQKAETGKLKVESGDVNTETRDPDDRPPSVLTSSLFSHAPKSPQVSGFSFQLSGFEIHVISCTQVPMQSPEKLADNIWFHSLVVPKWGWLKAGYIPCIHAIRRKLGEISPDIVHAQGTERECAIGAAFSPYPRVLTIHGNLRLIRKLLRPHPWSALALQSHIEALAVPRFAGVVCISNYTRRAIERETPKTWVVPNAVDPDFLSLGDEREKIIQNSESIPQPRDQNSTILVVANVDARKNQIAFIEALDPLAAPSGVRVKFFGRCGDDVYGEKFRAMVATRPWCEYGGMISRESLRNEFARAAIVALPSHEDNCPMVVLEAQAAGLPVMASNVGGVPDLVEDQVTGLLTRPDSAGSMRGAIEKLLTDPALVSRLVQNGRRQARERFHPRAVAERHLEIYREVLRSAKS